MGGRGASVGISKQGKKYGTEYKTLYEKGKVKFITPTSGSARTPMETMSKGRIYVTINNKNEIKSITFYDRKNKRRKQIDVTGYPHKINGKNTLPHVHLGFSHNEKGDRDLTRKERRIVARIKKIWYNRRNK
nr:MAG TPA: hypothetical protein [Caudoviricetes sp.]